MRRYESIAIVDPDISEELVNSWNDRVTELIEQNNGFLVLLDDWGIRNLAYEVRKKTRGHYIRLDYCGMGPLVNELERFFRIDDRVMKYITILTDAKADVDQIRAEMAAKEAETVSESTEAAVPEVEMDAEETAPVPETPQESEAASEPKSEDDASDEPETQEKE